MFDIASSNITHKAKEVLKIIVLALVFVGVIAGLLLAFKINATNQPILFFGATLVPALLGLAAILRTLDIV